MRDDNVFTIKMNIGGNRPIFSRGITMVLMLFQNLMELN